MELACSAICLFVSTFQCCIKTICQRTRFCIGNHASYMCNVKIQIGIITIPCLHNGDEGLHVITTGSLLC